MTDNLKDRLAGLRTRPKPDSVTEQRAADAAGESLGFVDRTPRKKPGRKVSPRSYQLHPKVMPEVGEAIAAEAEFLGITQGALIEAMWSIYKSRG